MATRTEAIERYVEAVRGLRAIKAAIKDEGETDARHAALLRARAELHDAEVALDGGQLGAARRILARPAVA